MERVFLYLLERSAGAAVLIGVVVLLRVLLRGAPKTFRLVLWALVAVRLLCPYAPESPLSLMPDTPTISAAAPRNVDIVTVTEPVTAFLPETVPYPVPVRGETPTPVSASAPTPIQILSAVWCAGLCALLAWSLYSYFKLRRVVAASLTLRDGVRICDDIASPFVLGIVRPCVYVPSGLSGTELSCVLAHEHAHIRRGDHVWKLCAWLLTCLYWFHPLVWLSYALFCRDMELACDEAAIRDMDAPRRAAYSETLLQCGLHWKKLQVACPLAFGELSVKERVKAVLRYRKPAFWATCAAVCVCVAAAACFLTRPVDTDADAETVEPNADAETVELGADTQTTEPDTAVSDGKEPLLWVCNDADANWPNLEETRTSVEFPGVTFRWTPEQVSATDADGVETVLFSGMPVWSVYFSDLNGDGYSELCSMVSFGSGIIDERILVYDYKAGRLSELQDRTHYNYTLSLEDNALVARQWKDNWSILPYSAPLVTGTLRMTAAGKLLLVPSNPDAIAAAPRMGEALSGELESAVRAAIIEHNRPRHASGAFDAESHVLLSIFPDAVDMGGEWTPAVSTVRLGLISLWESFDYHDGRFERVSGRSGHVVLTFRMEDGTPVLSDYWEPRDGSYYWPDVRDKFPSSLSDRELDTQTYILWENQELYRQAVEHWHVDTTPIIDALFDEIMSEPSPSSNPGDYLNAHPLALRELLYYDAYTSAYIDANIGTAQGLRQALMQLVAQRLRGNASSVSELGKLSHATLTHVENHGEPTQPGTYTLSDPEKLSKLAELLQDAEPTPMTKCPFDDPLTLTGENGETLQLMMAADSCAVYRCGGLYYKYASDNSAFYSLFE